MGIYGGLLLQEGIGNKVKGFFDKKNTGNLSKEEFNSIKEQINRDMEKLRKIANTYITYYKMKDYTNINDNDVIYENITDDVTIVMDLVCVDIKAFKKTNADEFENEKDTNIINKRILEQMKKLYNSIKKDCSINDISLKINNESDQEQFLTVEFKKSYISNLI